MKAKKNVQSIHSWRLMLIAGSLLLAMLACNIPIHIVSISPSATSLTPTSELTATPVPLPTRTPEHSAVIPTVQTPTEIDNCYLGSWALINISDLITPILTENNIKSVKYTGSTGTLILSFSRDMKIALEAKQYHSLFNAKMGFFPITVDVLIDGSGSGDYRFDANNSLLISNPNFGGINFSASASSINILPPTPLTHLIPALGDSSSGQAVSLNSTCGGDSLSFESGIANEPPLKFTRITP